MTYKKNTGKIIGAGLGLLSGGIIGAIIGLAIGSAIDNYSMGPLSSMNQAKRDYIYGLLVLIAAVMKADGSIKKSELNYVKAFLRNSHDEKTTLGLLKILQNILTQDIPLNHVCFQIRKSMRYGERIELLHFLFKLAHADSEIHITELQIILFIGKYLGINAYDVESLKSMYFTYNKANDNYSKQTSNNYELESCYTILKIPSTATDDEVRKAYKTMAVKHHPDKVAHMGEMAQQTATEKIKKINDAYEKIKKHRGIK